MVLTATIIFVISLGGIFFIVLNRTRIRLETRDRITMSDSYANNWFTIDYQGIEEKIKYHLKTASSKIAYQFLKSLAGIVRLVSQKIIRWSHKTAKKIESMDSQDK